MRIHTNKAFTLVELIVVIVILAILATIAFISLQGFSKDSRNSARASDSKVIEESLKLYYLEENKYPMPDDYTTMSYSGSDIYHQGTFSGSIYEKVGRLSHIPLDPSTNLPYVYSVTNTQLEYQLLTVYEGNLLSKSNILNKTYAANEDFSTKLNGNYNRIFIRAGNYYIPLPSIINAELETAGIKDLSLNTALRDSFVVSNGANFPDLGGNIEQSTGALVLSDFSVFEGPIEDDVDKQALADVLINTYSGSSELSSLALYDNIINTTDKVEMIDNVILKKTAALSSSDGGSELLSYISCNDILNSGSSSGDGVYEIDPDGDGGNDPFDVYCDMTTDGGGWTLVTNVINPSSNNTISSPTSYPIGNVNILSETYSLSLFEDIGLFQDALDMLVKGENTISDYCIVKSSNINYSCNGLSYCSIAGVNNAILENCLTNSHTQNSLYHVFLVDFPTHGYNNGNGTQAAIYAGLQLESSPYYSWGFGIGIYGFESGFPQSNKTYRSGSGPNWGDYAYTKTQVYVR